MIWSRTGMTLALGIITLSGRPVLGQQFHDAARGHAVDHSHPSVWRSAMGSSKEHDPKLIANFRRTSRSSAAVTT